MNILDDYQEHQILSISRKFADGKKRIINQLDTGGGKTVEFATISHRYISKSSKRVCIFVHRFELMQQTARTLKEWYNIDAQCITASTKHIYDRKVYICMVETIYRRVLRHAKFLPFIGLNIYDEVHIGNFRKVYDLFPDSLHIGFTATPLSSNKLHPMKNDFEDIVVGPGIQYLIQLNKINPNRGLVQNITYSVKGVNRSKLVVKSNGQFDENFMAFEYSKVKHVQNTIAQYELRTPGTKAIVYNCNIQHSILVAQAFRDKGYDVRHVDGSTPEDEREKIFAWFKMTPGSILCNVGVATMGLDVPTIETVIVNRSTESLVLWLQMCGRGGRPCPLINKKFFTIIDMGGNARVHGDWNQPRDWENIFFNPPKKKNKQDAAPYKDCMKCHALIPTQSMVCPYCGYIYERKEVVYDSKIIELELVTKNLDVKLMMEANSSKKDYYTLFQIENNLITQVKYKTKGNITDDVVDKAWNAYLPLIEDWCTLTGKVFKKMKGFCHKHMNDKFKELGWVPSKLKKIEEIF